MPPYRRYSVTMEILSFPFLFARKFSSMRTHFAAVSPGSIEQARVNGACALKWPFAPVGKQKAVALSFQA